METREQRILNRIRQLHSLSSYELGIEEEAIKRFLLQEQQEFDELVTLLKQQKQQQKQQQNNRTKN